MSTVGSSNIVQVLVCIIMTMWNALSFGKCNIFNSLNGWFHPSHNARCAHCYTKRCANSGAVLLSLSALGDLHQEVVCGQAKQTQL